MPERYTIRWLLFCFYDVIDRGGCAGLLFSWWLDCCPTFRAHRTQSSTALCLIISVGACATRCKGIVGVAAIVVAAYLRVSGMTGRSTCACNACKAPTWLAARRRATRQTQPHIRRSLPAPINRQRSSVRCQYIINITLRRFGLLWLSWRRSWKIFVILTYVFVLTFVHVLDQHW